MGRSSQAVRRLALAAVVGSVGSGCGPLGAQEPTVLLHGRVVDARGAAVPVAEVWITELDDMAQLLARGHADAEGEFRVPRVPLRGSWAVFARGHGCSVARCSVASAEQPVRLGLQPALRLAGTLRRADGSPAVGVVVRGISFALRPPIDELSTTDSEGRWRFDHLSPGPMSLVAAVPGEGLHCCNGWQLAHDEQVQLRRGGTQSTSLTVRLQGMPAAAAGKVFVELSPDGGFAGLPPPWHHAALDQHGEVTLYELPVVPYTVRLRSRDVLVADRELQVAPRLQPQTLTFRVQDEEATVRALSVQLCTPTGEVLPGVPLLLQSNATAGARPSLATTDNRGVASFDCSLFVGEGCSVRSASDAFVVVGITTQATPSSGVDWLRECVHAAHSFTTKVLAVRALRVHGCVLDAQDAPVHGATVVLAPADYELGGVGEVATAVTGPDGRYQLQSANAGDTQLLVAAGVRDAQVFSRAFDLDGRMRSVDAGVLRLRPTGCLRVRAVDGRGNPAAGVLLQLSRLLANRSRAPVGVAVTDVDGLAQFSAVGVGDLDLAVKPQGERGPATAVACAVAAQTVSEVVLTVLR